MNKVSTLGARSQVEVIGGIDNMASQYTKMKEKFDKYASSPVADQSVVREMSRMLQMANTVDTDALKKAREIFDEEV